MAIGWVIFIAYCSFCVGFATHSIFSATKIALMRRELRAAKALAKGEGQGKDIGG